MLSFLIGILISKSFNLNSLLSLLSVFLFVNSKQAFTIWIRQKDPTVLYILSGQIVLGTVLVLFAYSSEAIRLIPFAIIPLIYIASLYLLGEHAVITELIGFATLTIAAPLARFSVSGSIDLPLYIAITIFFMAGVLKVRVQLRKGSKERLVMVTYILIAFMVYSLLKIHIIMLLPLIDNIIFALTLYRVKLSTTGWIEVVKSILFVILSISFYQ